MENYPVTVYNGIIPQSTTNDIDAIMQLESSFEAIGLKRVIGSFRTMFSVGIMLGALKSDDDKKSETCLL